MHNPPSQNRNQNHSIPTMHSVQTQTQTQLRDADHPREIRIVEVSPRDGLQNIPTPIPTPTKLSLISRLAKTGLSSIEITSVVSPRKIPQLADARDVLGSEVVQRLFSLSSPGSSLAKDGHKQRSGDGESAEGIPTSIRCPVLVPNLRGLETALEYGVQEIAVIVSAGEGFSKANINCSVEEGLRRAVGVASVAVEKGVAVRGYISCIFTDPLPRTPAEITIPHSTIHHLTATLLAAGCYEISLGDTTGSGTPELTTSLLEYLTQPPSSSTPSSISKHSPIPVSKLAAHFHDTSSLALSNVWAAYTAGVRVFDASVAGLGGCPFAPGAKGNVATEELVGMFESKGVRTGVDRGVLEGVVGWIRDVLLLEEEKKGMEGGKGADVGKEKEKERGDHELGRSISNPISASTGMASTRSRLQESLSLHQRGWFARPMGVND
ncbi:hypothetical protein BJY04DRAFT_221241 [Aspergillus karnatakaensis]|uniref:hydroxymethylglutaryl-CoA lyase n=1 Tax=Aspergillus karnatakaensis TaxID=1810916 RepID=UPI003CCE1511